MCGCYVAGDKCRCETLMALEMRSVPTRQTDGRLLCEEVLGFSLCNEVTRPSVKISKRLAVKSGTGFFFLWHSGFITFKSPPSRSNLAHVSCLNCVTKTYKKQQLQTKIVIRLAKREKTTYRAACSFFRFHIPLASPTNWQVQLYSSYNEGQRGTSTHQSETLCLVFSSPGSQFPPLLPLFLFKLKMWGCEGTSSWTRKRHRFHLDTLKIGQVRLFQYLPRTC